jgi:uncharacterized iron-regulated membrane protein
MATDLESARDDLAYMRSLVTAGSQPLQSTMGEAFMWAGTLYGGQCLLHWLQTLHLAPEEGLGALAIAFGPTVMFCIVLGFIIWKDRKKSTGRCCDARASALCFRAPALPIS